MIGSPEVVLEPATLRDAAVLSNLMELYSHDLSDVFALEPAPMRASVTNATPAELTAMKDFVIAQCQDFHVGRLCVPANRATARRIEARRERRILGLPHLAQLWERVPLQHAAAGAVLAAAGPFNGQAAFDVSLQVTANSTRRTGTDYAESRTRWVTCPTNGMKSTKRGIPCANSYSQPLGRSRSGATCFTELLLDLR